MVEQIVDLHIHSKYSRACSKHLSFESIATACEIRGIDMVVTGDMTHPAWFASMRDKLKEDTEGVYKLKDGTSVTKFVIGTELSSIKKHKGKTRRVHLCVFAPNLEVAEKFNKVLDTRGFNLKSDGRPILGLPCKDILELMLGVDRNMVMVPAHAWTPWFGIFGSKGGYDSLEDCFEDLTPYIRAIETGLSSDPLMNWRLSALDNITLISNSDAHSTQKLGREANVLEFASEADVTYNELFRIINEEDKKKFKYTIEFYPEEGKYHCDGHRDCNVVMEPEETKKNKGICPKCRRKLTIGVLNRVFELADRSIDQAKEAGRHKIPYRSLVPLPEILADTFGCGVSTKRVNSAYDLMIDKLGSEFNILMNSSVSDIESATDKYVADAIDRVRNGHVVVRPGYDGEFGVVKVFDEGKESRYGKQLDINF